MDTTPITFASNEELTAELGRRVLATDQGAMIMALIVPTEDNNQQPTLHLNCYGKHPPASQMLLRGLCTAFKLTAPAGQRISIPAPVFPDGVVSVVEHLSPGALRSTTPPEDSGLSVQAISQLMGDMLSRIPDTIITRSSEHVLLQTVHDPITYGQILRYFGYNYLGERPAPTDVNNPQDEIVDHAHAHQGAVLHLYISPTSPIAVALARFGDDPPGAPLRVALVGRDWIFNTYGE